MGVLVIAEPGMTWDRDLDKAYRLIDAAKECGADVCKFQWTSSGKKIQQRRQVDEKYVGIYERGVQYPREWLELLKAHCDKVGIEFACTTYLIEDIAVVAPLVRRFKISAFESGWYDFIRAHPQNVYPTIISCNTEDRAYGVHSLQKGCNRLYCVSEYPAPLEHLKLSELWADGVGDHAFDGYSDHSANVLTGCAAVAAGVRIIESHIRLQDTSKDNPDYPHSLVADFLDSRYSHNQDRCYREYVRNIRTVERML